MCRALLLSSNDFYLSGKALLVGKVRRGFINRVRRIEKYDIISWKFVVAFKLEFAM